MKNILMLCMLILAGSGVHAQKTYLNNRLLLERIGNNSNLVTGNTGAIAGLPSAPPGVIGDAFLRNYFSEAVLLLFEGDQVVGGYAVKYDIQRDDFYLRRDKTVRVLEGSKVKNVMVMDSLSGNKLMYVNGNLLKDPAGAPYLGFFEVIRDGKLALLRRTEIEIKAPDFHPALNVGSKDHRVVKHQKLFYARDGVASLIPQGKKIMGLFPGQEEKVAGFIKVNKLNLKSDTHLKGLFEYYESLTGQ